MKRNFIIFIILMMSFSTISAFEFNNDSVVTWKIPGNLKNSETGEIIIFPEEISSDRIVMAYFETKVKTPNPNRNVNIFYGKYGGLLFEIGITEEEGKIVFVNCVILNLDTNRLIWKSKKNLHKQMTLFK